MDGRKIVGWNVRKLRVALGFSIEELADRAGLGDSFVSKLERGQVNASIDNLELLAKSLRADLADLLVKPRPGEKPPAPLKAGRRPQRQSADRPSEQPQSHVDADRPLMEHLLLQAQTALLNGMLPVLQKVLAEQGSSDPRRDALLHMREMPWLNPLEIWEIDQLLGVGDQDRKRSTTKLPKPKEQMPPLTGERDLQRPPAIRAKLSETEQFHLEALIQKIMNNFLEVRALGLATPGMARNVDRFLEEMGQLRENLASPQMARNFDRFLEEMSQLRKSSAGKLRKLKAQVAVGRKHHKPHGLTRGKSPH